AALLHIGMSKTARREKVKTLLNNLGLGERLDNLPSELSIGQQQRVTIARALANEPALILADEPTGELDAETAEEIIDHLITPVREKGVTLVIATHGIFPLDVADRVLYMKDGTLIRQK
ncbi:MAG TPA: ATP-binding cassette domain-containing protein, partial [Sedimentisphaerales bacterium]|nr:ATP-binding cassette domain-containing protein [Sedimentisphaerales bacterium]